jgi:hypothetical protein
LEEVTFTWPAIKDEVMALTMSSSKRCLPGLIGARWVVSSHCRGVVCVISSVYNGARKLWGGMGLRFDLEESAAFGSFDLLGEQRQDLATILSYAGISKPAMRLAALCDAVLVSISAYQAVTGMARALGNDPQLRGLVQLLLAHDPSLGLIRRRVAELPEALIQRIEAMALRRSEQVAVLRPLADGFRDWVKHAGRADILATLRLCLVDGGVRVSGRRRPNGKQSAPRFEAMIFGQCRGLKGVPKLVGGRPADDAEVRLISMLAVDWLLSTGLEPEAGRDGHLPFSCLVHDVFGWLNIGAKAQHCLRQYWALVKVKRVRRW